MPYKDVKKRLEYERWRRADPVQSARDQAARGRYKNSEKGKVAVQRGRVTYYQIHKDTERARHRAYNVTHKEYLNRKSLEWTRANPQRKRAINRKSTLKTRYGITEVQLEALGQSQGWTCGICSGSLLDLDGIGRKKLSVDHCHQTGRIRGLLCSQCNRGLGHFQDRPDLLERALAYLKEALDVVGR
jgi:hypothetical protein